MLFFPPRALGQKLRQISASGSGELSSDHQLCVQRRHLVFKLRCRRPNVVCYEVCGSHPLLGYTRSQMAVTVDHL